MREDSRKNRYLEYENPIQIVWRKGTPDDPYSDRLDITKVVNQRIVLLEIPDTLYRVRAAGMTEINYDAFIKERLEPNEFYVDYTNGFVYFHASKEAQTISLLYKGRGFLLYPSTRIVNYDGTNPAESLHDLINRVQDQIKLLIQETENFNDMLEKMIIATNSANDATDRANQATQKAEEATELVKDAYKTTVLIYMPYVQTYDDIAKTYPIPEVGWTTQVYDSGIRYRWNGQEWVPIDALGGNVPLANELIDGLMSKEDYIKLRDIPEDIDDRVIVFMAQPVILEGVIPCDIKMVLKGTISGIEAYCSETGDSDTVIEIVKSTDYITWTPITATPVTIPTDSHVDDGAATVVDRDINIGDVIRLRATSSGMPSGLNLNIKFKQVN